MIAIASLGSENDIPLLLKWCTILVMLLLGFIRFAVAVGRGVVGHGFGTTVVGKGVVGRGVGRGVVGKGDVEVVIGLGVETFA